MGKTVGDLTLDDEHMSGGVDDTLQEAAKRLLTIRGGIVVVLGDEHRVKGVIGQRQLIKALSQGVDASAVQCHQHMEMDFMQVRRSDDLKRFLLTSSSEVHKPLSLWTKTTNSSVIFRPVTTKRPSNSLKI